MFPLWGPFSLGHRCPERSLRVVILGEDEEEEGDEEKSTEEMAQKQMELSSFST